MGFKGEHEPLRQRIAFRQHIEPSRAEQPGALPIESILSKKWGISCDNPNSTDVLQYQ
jgi:hypothetical protein